MSFKCRQATFNSFFKLAINLLGKHSLTAIPYRVSTGPEQGFPCVLFPNREKPDKSDKSNGSFVVYFLQSYHYWNTMIWSLTFSRILLIGCKRKYLEFNDGGFEQCKLQSYHSIWLLIHTLSVTDGEFKKWVESGLSAFEIRSLVAELMESETISENIFYCASRLRWVNSYWQLLSVINHHSKFG